MSLLILATELLKLPVVALAPPSRVGRVYDILIDTDTAQFQGLMVVVDWLSPHKFVSSRDIISIDPSGIVVGSPNDVVSIDEVVRAKAAYKRKFKLIGIKVKTQSGKNLGWVNDAVISIDVNRVVRFYVSNFITDRIITWPKVIKIEKGLMLVEDDFEIAKAQPAMGRA